MATFLAKNGQWPKIFGLLHFLDVFEILKSVKSPKKVGKWPFLKKKVGRDFYFSVYSKTFFRILVNNFPYTIKYIGVTLKCSVAKSPLFSYISA